MNSNARMDKKRKWIIGIVVVIIILGVFWKLKDTNLSTIQDLEKQDKESIGTSMLTSALSLDVKNADYVIGDRKVVVRDGVATEHGSSNASVVKTTILEGTAYADIDGDGAAAHTERRTAFCSWLSMTSAIMAPTWAQSVTEAILTAAKAEVEKENRTAITASDHAICFMAFPLSRDVSGDVPDKFRY